MKNFRVIKIFAFFLFLFAANNFAFAKSEYVAVRSKNFQFVGEASEEKIRREALRLEQFREALRLAFPELKVDAPVQPTILIFKDAESFAPVKPVNENGFADRSVSGFFQSSGEDSFIAFPVSGDGDKSSGTIFHEYLHFVIKNNFQTNALPVWLNEGLAEYFQTFRMKNDRKAIFGEAHKEHLWTLRQYKMLSLKTLSAVNYESLTRMSADEKKLFYAESWAIIHFLTRKNSNSLLALVKKFIALEAGGETFENAFRQAFGATLSNAEIELERYVSKKSFDSEQINFGEKLSFETRLETKYLGESEWLGYLGDLYLQSERYDAAIETLRKSLALDGRSAKANLSLGRVFMRQGNYRQAAAFFEKAFALDSENYAANYFLADALFRENLSADGYVTRVPSEQAKRIRVLLKNSVAQNPNLIEAYKMLASVSLANDDELAESIEYVRTALKIEPQNFRLEYNLAQLLLRKRDFENARFVAENLRKNCIEKDFCERVKSFTEALNSIEQKEKELAELRKKYGLENVDFAEENLLPPEEAMSRALNRSLRKPLENEKRFVGNLSEIVCGEKILFIVENENKVLKLSKDSFDGISLISFSRNTAGMRIECGKPKIEMFVVVTYKENLAGKLTSDGEIFVLEFVPKEFKLIK